MEKDFHFLRSPGEADMDSPTSPGSSGMGASMPHYEDQHMGEVHRAASVGDLERVKQILLFRKNIRNDRDMMSRTALHVASGKGHPGVVRLLALRHCLLNLCDIDNKTALIHAVQCEQEECVTILLDHGADPNVMDIHGNTALHYAVLTTNTAIVEKLLSCMANMEARNKNDLTPLLLAKYEDKAKMVQFLATRTSKVHPMESNQQPTSEKKEKRKPLESSQSNNLVTRLKKSLKKAWSRRKSNKVCDISEEDSLCSKHGIAVSCPTSDNVSFKVAEKNNQTSGEKEVLENTCAAANNDSDRNELRQQSNNEQRDTQQPNDNINENAAILINEVEEQKTQTSSKREVSGNMHDGAEDISDSVGERKNSSTEQRDKQQLPLEEKNNSDRNGSLDSSCGLYTKHVIGTGFSCSTVEGVISKVEEENKQTSSEKEVSGNICAGAGDNNDRNGLKHQRDSEQTDTQKPNDQVNENTVFLMNKVEEKEEQKSSEKEETGNKYHGADHSDSDGLSQFSNSKETGNQQPNDVINENTVILMNKAEEKKEHSVGVGQESNSKPTQKQQLPIVEKVESHSFFKRSGFPHWCCGFYSKRRIGIAVSCPTSDSELFKVEEENKQTSSEKEVSGNICAGAGDNNDRNGLKHRRDSEQTDTQKPNDQVNENTVFLMNKVEEKEEQKSSEKEETGNKYHGADHSDSDGLSKFSNSKETGNQQPNDVINENTVILMNKVEEKKEHSVGVGQESNSKPTQKQQLPVVEKVESHRNRFSHLCCGFYSRRRIAVAYPTLENVIFKSKVEGENRQTRSKKEVSGNTYAVTNDDSDRNGLRHQNNSEQIDTQQSNEKINENTVFLMNKVEEKKEQKSSKREESGNMFDVTDNDTDSVGVRQKSNSEQSDEHQFPIVQSEDSDRSTLQKEKEMTQKADVLYPKDTAHLRKKGQCMKAVEMNPKVENTIGTQVMALKTVVEEQNYTQRQLSEGQKMNILQDGILTKHPCKPKGIKVLSQVSDSDEKEKSLIDENCILKDENAKLTLELDTAKNQMQEMEKKYFEDIVIGKEKNDHFQKTVTETLLQHSETFKVLRAELNKLSTKLEDIQQNRGRLEAEGDSYSSRRATVLQYHEHCQTSKGNLQVAFKKEKEEYFCSQGKKNSDMSDIKHSIKIPSQQLSKFESKSNHLEIDLHSTRDAFRYKTFVLQDEEDQSQTQSQTKETEHVYQQEQAKVDKDTGKQEFLQEMLSHLQNENKFLQKQLDEAQHKADKKIKIKDQLADTIKILQANCEKQGLMLKETCKELINEWNLLKENTHQYENDKAERDAFMSHLQGELADTQRKLSSTQALPKEESQHCMDFRYKIQALQKELDETRSELQHEKKESEKLLDLSISLQQSLHEVMKQKTDLEKSMTRCQEPLNTPKRNFNEEPSFAGASKPSLMEMTMETRRIQQEVDELVAEAKCMHRPEPEEDTAQQELELQMLNKKCDEMTPRVEWWKEAAIIVRRHMEMSRARHQEEERRLDRLGECGNPYLAYTLEQVRQTFQF